MEIRNLEKADFSSVFRLVKGVYEEVPISMWFKEAPDEDTFRNIFDQKISGVELGEIVDLVAIDNDSLIAECEIVSRGEGLGVVGLLVSRDYRKKGIGGSLLGESIRRAKEMEMKRLYAEVSMENKAAIEFLEEWGFRQAGNIEGIVRLEKTL